MVFLPELAALLIFPEYGEEHAGRDCFRLLPVSVGIQSLDKEKVEGRPGGWIGPLQMLKLRMRTGIGLVCVLYWYS